MPIFELDEERPRLVQPMQPLAGAFAQECAMLVRHHLAAIAGEPLFPVRARSAAPDHAHLPELLALDATGRPVVLEVVQVVDDDAVVSALRHAGAAARMTTTDLARAYHADPSRFGVEFAAFREQVAFGAQTSRREGVRLVLLCSEVAAEAADTLGYLRGPGRHVDILQVGVVRGSDDRRLIDVSPLARHETSRRAVEPTALRLVRSSEASFASAMAYEGERRALPTPKPWSAERTSSGELRTVPSAPPRPRPSQPAQQSTQQPAQQLAQDSTQQQAPRSTTTEPTPAVPEPPMPPMPPVPTPPPSFPADSSSAPAVSSGPPSDPVRTPVLPRRPDGSLRTDGQPRTGLTPPAGGPTAGPAPLPPGAPPRTSAFDVPTQTPPGTRAVEPPPAPAPVAGPPVLEHAPAGLVDLPHPRLATLAKQRRAVTTLVWLRERRGQRVVATLRHDGLIQTPTGGVFADPSHAAAAAVGASTEVDGWRAWRIGDGGPTLGEATGFSPS
ncbi:hypothetical protein [Cellulomonas sp. HZM]|uniref:restriction system modified-DNA reader domain-containing protein n=1 Tax=Cellulomonas sp. HZM TaxID=1454010 RepID=UPI000493242F|nr:hypothetical protein [Cellulomonas sp. HZM]